MPPEAVTEMLPVVPPKQVTSDWDVWDSMAAGPLSWTATAPLLHPPASLTTTW